MKKISNIIHYLFYVCIGIILVFSLPTNASKENQLDLPFSISGNLNITGISDGDSMRSGKLRIRLFGVDAPEIDQRCTNAVGKAWDCGIAAQKALKKLVGSVSQLSCKLMDIDFYGRLVMRCYAGEIDIAGALVRAGMALAYRKYSSVYGDDENTAKVSQSGMWAGSFVEPWKWRRTQ